MNSSKEEYLPALATDEMVELLKPNEDLRQVLQRHNQEIDSVLKNNADTKLAYIQSTAVILAELVAALKSEAISDDPNSQEQCMKLLMNVNQRLAEIKAVVLSFKTAVDLEFPPLHWFFRLFYCWGQDGLLTRVKKRRVYKETIIEVEKFIASQEEVLKWSYDRMNAPVLVSQQKFLKETEYPKILAETYDAQKDLESLSGRYFVPTGETNYSYCGTPDLAINCYKRWVNSEKMTEQQSRDFKGMAYQSMEALKATIKVNQQKMETLKQEAWIQALNEFRITKANG